MSERLPVLKLPEIKKFQNIELYETDNFQYLLIHKNGSTSVLECIKHLNPIATQKCNFNKVRWTVIREPYERFVSGLEYDLKRQNVELKDIESSSLHSSRINGYSRQIGNVNHTASQIPYLMNTNIDWYVELKDLSTFLQMHFDNVEYLNPDDNENKVEVEIDKLDVDKYLDLDYYVYKDIINSPNLWKWQNGRIF